MKNLVKNVWFWLYLGIIVTAVGEGLFIIARYYNTGFALMSIGAVVVLCAMFCEWRSRHVFS